MNKQNPIDLSLLGLGILLAIGSLTAWIHIGFISVQGTSTWWGFVTLVASLAVMVHAVTKLWPHVLDESIAKHTKNIAIGGLIASFVVLAYVGIRLTDASRQFNDAVAQESPTDTSLSGLGSDFQDSMNEFTKSLADAFNPSLALGWYLSAASTIGGAVLIFKKRDEELAEIPNFDPPSL